MNSCVNELPLYLAELSYTICRHDWWWHSNALSEVHNNNKPCVRKTCSINNNTLPACFLYTFYWATLPDANIAQYAWSTVRKYVWIWVLVRTMWCSLHNRWPGSLHQKTDGQGIIVYTIHVIILSVLNFLVIHSLSNFSQETCCSASGKPCSCNHI